MTPLTFWLNAFALWKIKPNSVCMCVSQVLVCAQSSMCLLRPLSRWVETFWE